MMRPVASSLLLTGLLLLGSSGSANAQHHAAHHAPPGAPADTTLRALSPEQVAAYRSGAGMGLAKAAELNHYPGPKHVLELAGALQITEEQRQAAEALYAEVQADAVPLGEQIVEAEQRLDALFADAAATPEAVRVLTDELGRLQGALRFVHLNAHLAMRAALTPEQIARYDTLRGYAADAPIDHNAHH